MSAVVAVAGLVKRFGSTTALDGLDLDVEPGTIHGFLNLRKGIPSAQDDLARCLAYLKTWVERAR